jgi:uracil-DNA glycosylase
MFRVTLPSEDAFDEFREAARALALAGIKPDDIVWRVGEESDFFAERTPRVRAGALNVPASYLQLAKDVICHSDPQRFALLYRLLWRIAEGERHLMNVHSDPLVHRLTRMQKAVERDAHKMHAFVRFRQMSGEDGEHYVAWFEPEHHILRRVADFFVGRFASMRWAIFTPRGSLAWDGREVKFGPPVARAQVPTEDALDAWWRTYYGATFNPARANPDAMRAEMPKRYWHNLPEAGLIPGLLADAVGREKAMLAAAPTPARAAASYSPAVASAPPAGSLAELRTVAASCERCPLHREATQTVFGVGPVDAAIVFVGEQPGDQEDLAGLPFVGPAGQMFDRALAEAGIDRARTYVTNAVKHFKFVPRGKRRIHQRPNSDEIEHCRWWLDRELALIKPRLTVALGATAARALTGRDQTISRVRGKVIDLPDGRVGFITVHPSFLLRLPDPEAQAREYARFVADLQAVARHLPEIRLAA